MFDLTGQVALLTGAGRGIGLAMAKALSAAGCAIALQDIDLEVAQAEASAFLKQLGQYRAIVATNPDYLNALWLDDMTRLYTRMRETGCNCAASAPFVTGVAKLLSSVSSGFRPHRVQRFSQSPFRVPQ